jgi:CheY-like chemotaxis protein/predicted regulator of Ras-like GTPase activity (Roadblock/LC7/MglB family)
MPDEIKRVLVVDDEDDLTWSISKNLEKDKERYELICVNSGKKALEVLSQLPIALVISDIRMPEISGLDLLVKIKDYYPATKVIIMTAYGSSEIHEQANARGCLKYIEKPFEINDLRQLIVEAIEEKKGFKGTITDFHLSDLIQMNCLGRMTSALYVSRDENNGVIYFQEGNLIHAQCNGLEGEEALYEMLLWEGGSFSTKRGKTSPKETIIKGWQSLLLEAMQRVDESKPTHSLPIMQDRDIIMARTLQVLNKLISLKGVLIVSVFDPDGFPIASNISEKFPNKYSMNEVTPVVSNLIKQVDTVGDELKIEHTKDITVEFGKAVLRMTRVQGKKEFLVILADNTINQSVLHLEAKKHLRQLAKIL